MDLAKLAKLRDRMHTFRTLEVFRTTEHSEFLNDPRRRQLLIIFGRLLNKTERSPTARNSNQVSLTSDELSMPAYACEDPRVSKRNATRFDTCFSMAKLVYDSWRHSGLTFFHRIDQFSR